MFYLNKKLFVIVAWIPNTDKSNLNRRLNDTNIKIFQKYWILLIVKINLFSWLRVFFEKKLFWVLRFILYLLKDIIEIIYK